ncbi:hypothetical protein SARC_09036 [Sphaeroforma arctica JP610]|uniref:Uncharacterized protein n=1 Tax=Sphaeroforma arctica JP610 TaxID=667725 RepID=A0A0L0FP17_9EUKA|nr:hypothetical protein SARC_09036 [Sphaeroforma arctica JP610]KNC78542.1 hypothetical protein SARC_09036 [Sphaeroforma arctica JP610]|eukprot:XP_014152444.1 hypothetical protein SARC_09036 [Sphaeroforma arctica JP610]
MDFVQDSFDNGLLEWTVGATTFQPTFRYVDTGYREAGNGQATFDATNATLNTELREDLEYDNLVKRVDDVDTECDVWVAQPTSKQAVKARDAMFNDTLRAKSAERLNRTLNSAVVDKILMTMITSDPSVYDELAFPNLFGPYLSSQDQVGDYLDEMYERGARTVGFILEDDESLGNVHSRVMRSYLEERKDTHDWVPLNDPNDAIVLIPQANGGHIPDPNAYAEVVDKIYEEQNVHRKVNGFTNNVPGKEHAFLLRGI